MTLEREPTPELQVGRTGGRSAKVVALGVVFVLGVVVFVGLSGNTPASPAGTTRPLAAGTGNPPTPAVASPTPSEPTFGHVPRSPVAVINERSGLAGPYGDLRARLTVAGADAVAALDDVSVRRLHAAFRVVLPPDVLQYMTLELIEGLGDTGASYGSWAVPITIPSGGQSVDVDVGASAPSTLFQQDQMPDPTALAGAPALTRNGYRIRVNGSFVAGSATLNVDVLIANDPTFPDEGYNVVARAGKNTFRTNQSTLKVEPGHLSGKIFMPANLGVPKVSVELSALPEGARAPIVIATDTYRVRGESQGSQSTHSSTGAGDPDGTGPQILNNGYDYAVQFTFENGHRVVIWTLDIYPNFVIEE